MPGKVNPTQARGDDHGVRAGDGQRRRRSRIAGSQGHFELNVFKPVMIHNLLQSIRLLADAVRSASPSNCVVGIEPNRERIDGSDEPSLMLVTALNPHIGYDNAAKVAKKAHKDGTTLKEEAERLGFVSPDEFDSLVRPEDMVHPA